MRFQKMGGSPPGARTFPFAMLTQPAIFPGVNVAQRDLMQRMRETLGSRKVQRSRYFIHPAEKNAPFVQNE